MNFVIVVEYQILWLSWSRYMECSLQRDTLHQWDAMNWSRRQFISWNLMALSQGLLKISLCDYPHELWRSHVIQENMKFQLDNNIKLISMRRNLFLLLFCLFKDQWMIHDIYIISLYVVYCIFIVCVCVRARMYVCIYVYYCMLTYWDPYAVFILLVLILAISCYFLIFMFFLICHSCFYKSHSESSHIPSQDQNELRLKSRIDNYS